MNCLICDKPLSRKNQKYCSEAHKQQAKRNARQGDDTVLHKNDTVSLSVSDARFNDWRPGYYNFGDTVYKRLCDICNKEFETRMALLKVCSPEHYEELVGHVSGSTPGKVVISKAKPELRLTPDVNPRHAKLATEDALEAVSRFIMREGTIHTDWVIPGEHWVGKIDPIWSSCLNPDCITVITKEPAVDNQVEKLKELGVTVFKTTPQDFEKLKDIVDDGVEVVEIEEEAP